ncbi:Inositolphosphorylceramide synthase subunit Kei1-domain-containing protein [Exophiala viscosa]|uniref:Inositolphosphorylceramide synthase subunit Kei1-domain-containing protein n=1 Tax=Exophiala viscosa TaxID=2486360 RepID=A0AAN6DZS0_9EURO|nr:Inositolphosphorylceramide synthase subunit Kei1-domain-containing protein [Exophiala viscosa]KAI1623970.1 Inositolphosphorylceramide synthase subunit Kei1-domain-containing protein [Exophiala viscosa]
MGISTHLQRLGRPRRFLYTMTLSTGASLIALSLLVNKLAGFYGILALFTGYHLSPLQLSMYIYSVLGLILTAYLMPHIRKQSPLQCLALAWFYVLDSIINAAYTAAFAVTWFLVLAQHDAGQVEKSGPGAGTIDDTSGFTNPKYNVSGVDVIATPASGLAAGQDAVAAGAPAAAPAGSGSKGALQDVVLGTESMNSIGVIITLWTIRAYFCLIMLAFARMVIRQHIAASGVKTGSNSYTTASANANLAENPFAQNKPEGQGWRGRLGRVMLNIGRSYWLGSDEHDSWMYGMKFRKSTEFGIMLNKVEAGPTERERRRRSGTGPMAPGPGVTVKGKEDDGTLQVPVQNV